jgi:peroxin-14
MLIDNLLHHLHKVMVHTHPDTGSSRRHQSKLASRCLALRLIADIFALRLPKRDWRDWFIMATVMGGVSYGLYFTAKRYILPMISPPTPPQLAQDKASIDESFTRAFTLLDQLNTDTAALKASEEARTNRLDNALSEMESVLGSLKEASKRQGDDNRRIEDDVRSLRELIPKALDAHKETTDNRLKELGTELKSLKTLVGNRMSAGPIRSTSSSANAYSMPQESTPNMNGTPSPTVAQQPVPAVGGPAGGVSNATDGQGSVGAASSATPAVSTPERIQTPSYGRLTNGKATIPLWQMVVAKKNQEAEKKDTSESGTATEASPNT